MGILGNAFLALIMKNLMGLFEKMSRSNKMNSVVYVNNWMFSTDLYPDPATLQVRGVRGYSQLAQAAFSTTHYYFSVSQ